MSNISAQISVYPLRQNHLGPTLEAAIAELQGPGLEVEVGTMSTQVRGDDDVVFSALKTAFRKAGDYGDVVMVVTISNTCPVPIKLDSSP